jgi:hypothetical protein
MSTHHDLDRDDERHNCTRRKEALLKAKETAERRVAMGDPRFSGSEVRAIENRIDRIDHEASKCGGHMSVEEYQRSRDEAMASSDKTRKAVEAQCPGYHEKGSAINPDPKLKEEFGGV